MRKSLFIILFLTLATCGYSQEAKDSCSWSIRNNWLLQAGVDMTLQNPYGYPFKNTIPKGTSFGLDAAFAHRFTPETAVRFKANWENGFPLFKNNKLEWLTPFDEPGENMKRGGYLSIVGDIMFDIHNIICGHSDNRVWNSQVFLRAGGVYNFGGQKGSPLIGLGWGNTFRLSRHWGLYCDIAYNGVSSGFTMNGQSTGVGSGSNMYFDFNIGATYYIGGTQFEEHTNDGKRKYFPGFWNNWYLQFGADMTLYNPCEMSFKNVFPDGVACGLDVSLGKWFSPQFGFRGRINWENGLIENRNFKWLSGHREEGQDVFNPETDESNYEGGGCLMFYADATISAKHILMPYVPGEKWDCYAFGRLGLGKNRPIDSLSPLVGFGFGGTYRFDRNWSIYAETTYAGITSEFFDGVSWSGANGSNFNGIWDFNIGVQLSIGDLKF